MVIFLYYKWFFKNLYEWTLNVNLVPCQVKKRNSEESSTQWTTGIAEIQLPIEYAFSYLLPWPMGKVAVRFVCLRSI